MRELWSCFILHMIHSARGDSSCPAGAGAACVADETITASQVIRQMPSMPPAPTPQVDLIAQEMNELKSLLKLGEERMGFLKELQGAASSKGLLSVAQVHALTERLPLLSEVASQGEKEPIAAAEDFLLTKAALPLVEPAVQVEWLLLRNPRPPTTSSSSSSTPQSQMPTCLLAAAQADGKVHLFSPSGELVFSFNTGHDQIVTHMVTSPTHEEHLIATGDSGGAIRVHRVSVRQRRASKEEKLARSNSTDEKVSQYLGPQWNITVQAHRQLQLPVGDDAPTLTALAIANHKSSGEIVAGDSKGRISVFAKNGTLKAHVDATAMEGPGVEGLHSYHSQVLFRAGMEWGYVSLDKAEVKHIDCPNFEGRVADIAVDTQQLSKVLLSDEGGAVWVFNVKNRKDCELEKRFPAGEAEGALQLAAIRGFVIGLQKNPSPSKDPGVSSSSILALNMSQPVGRRRPGETGAGGHVIWRRQRLAVRDWTVQRKQHGDLIALLSADGREVEILEVLMQVYTPPPSSDPFSNFKLPVMACAVVLLLGYQFLKQKKGGSAFGAGSRGKYGKSDFASLLNKKKMGAGGLGGLKGKR
ncbi:unnamed protein product [Durusdinium trenchii]|uniref:Uncharacterized protein n=2 Tax=Durusdinium trenchii TaxID=1381693 RepID=A0ABP0JPB5_9DINO